MQTKAIPFRKQAKTDLNVWIPVAIAEEIREAADNTGRSIGSIVTEYLCRGMDRDPADFGIRQLAV